jgi:hypothetical protein
MGVVREISGREIKGESMPAKKKPVILNWVTTRLTR